MREKTISKPKKMITSIFLVSSLFGTSAVIAEPNSHCFDFSNLPVGSQYVVGDSLPVAHGTVDFIRFRLPDGTPINSPVSASLVENSSIAGDAPELRNKLINMRFTPDAPLSHVVMNYAQNSGPDNIYLDNNIIVNGEIVQLTNGMAGANGLVIGNNNRGQILVTSTLENPVPPNGAQWITGTLEFTALSGGIEAITVGGHTTAIDNYCFEF